MGLLKARAIYYISSHHLTKKFLCPLILFDLLLKFSCEFCLLLVFYSISLHLRVLPPRWLCFNKANLPCLFHHNAHRIVKSDTKNILNIRNFFTMRVTQQSQLTIFFLNFTTMTLLYFWKKRSMFKLLHEKKTKLVHGPRAASNPAIPLFHRKRVLYRRYTWNSIKQSCFSFVSNHTVMHNADGLQLVPL